MRDLANEPAVAHQARAAKPKEHDRAATRPDHRLGSYRYLQSAVGNQAVLRLLQDGSDATRQAAEEEADQIAARVAVPEHAPAGALPAGLAGRLGRETGADFTNVQVHSDAAAADRVARHDAEAMSEGRDVFFAAGRWRPDTPAGALLAAHEAVHAAQQGFAEGITGRAGRYFKKDPPPKADPRDVAGIIKERAPELAAFVDVKTINDAMAGGSPVGPAVPGGTSGTDVHEWHVTITVVPTATFSETARKPAVKTTKTKSGQLVQHVIPIHWGTFTPFGSGAEYEQQAEAAEKANALPAHARRPKDFAFELKVAEPLIHELLHARIIMETDPTYTAGPHVQLVQGYLDMIAASQSAAVKKQRDAVRAKVAVLAGVLTDQAPKGAELSDVVNLYDEFLVHEKYDSQKVFGIMGRSLPDNKTVATAYSKVVAKGLTIKFGEGALSDAEAAKQVQHLSELTADYFDAIDKALASPPKQPGSGGAAPPASSPKQAGSAGAAPPASPPKQPTPAKPPAK
jgi:Domain of unknown function (DUF4157)